MPTKPSIEVPFRARRVALVRLRRPEEDPWAIDAAFDALESWLSAAGRSVVYRVWQRRRAPAPATYLGRGKALQLRALCDLGQVETVVLDGTPTAAQRTNLEGLLERPVVDRSVWAPSGATDPTVSRTRTLHRRARRAGGAYNLVLIGCAGAGKSTLFAAITGALGSPAWPTAPERGRPGVMTRRLRGASGSRAVLVTDTPGLLWHPEKGLWSVPTETLAEWREADAVLHVVDASHPEAGRRVGQVRRVLAADDAGPSASTITVWTQADRVATGGRDQGGPTWVVSGRTGFGCDELIARLRRAADCRWDTAIPDST